MGSFSRQLIFTEHRLMDMMTSSSRNISALLTLGVGNMRLCPDKFIQDGRYNAAIYQSASYANSLKPSDAHIHVRDLGHDCLR